MKLLLLLPLIFLGCGDGKHKSAPPAPNRNAVEVMFQKSADTHKVPIRYMIAVAYLESQINPTPSTALYGETNAEVRGPKSQQTAFGLSREDLGLTEAPEDDLNAQIDAYGKWLAHKASGLNLQANPSKVEDKWHWLTLIAGEHRGNNERNLKALFLKELISILNKGFSWKAPNGKDPIWHFPPEQSPIDPTKVDALFQNQLLLYLQNSDSQLADLIPQIHPNKTGEQPIPKGILINHCPFSLSSCLEMQLETQDQEGVIFGSHYLIPQDDTIHPKPLQVSMNRNPVRYRNKSGELVLSDRIIITLVGESGFIAKSHRAKANPIWLNKWQMQRLGALVQDICQSITSWPQASVTYEQCMQMENEGIQFQLTEKDKGIQWGDINDFDKRIFQAHLQAYRGLAGEASFGKIPPKTTFTAGSVIPLKLQFPVQAKNITLQRLVRCPDQSLVWHSIQDLQVKAQDHMDFNLSYWDAGPNQDGQQFFRAKVYGNASQDNPKKQLLAWDTTSLFITQFEAKENGMDFDTQEACP